MCNESFENPKEFAMSDEIIDALDFEKRIEGMADRQLSEFIARQTFDINNRVSSLEISHKKTAGLIGGVTGAVTAIVIGTINYFLNRR